MNEKPPKQAMKTKQKTYNVKPKPIHYRVAQNLIENRGVISKAMIDAGYSEMTAHNPKNVTESKGFKQAMQELGLTDTFLVRFKLRGHLKETVQDSKTLILITSGESAKRYNVEPTS